MRRHRAPADSPGLAAALADVEGWLEPDEAWALHAAVRDHPRRPVVVEIGSWKGRSTIALALGAKARRGGWVYAVDPHQGIARLPELGKSYPDFTSNLQRARVKRYVKPILQRSAEASTRFALRSIDLLFVDGSHVYEDVLMDIERWTPRIVDGGLAAFHDAILYPGVRQAVGERVLAPSQFREPRLVDNTLLVRVRHERPWTEDDDQAAAALRRRLEAAAEVSA